MTFGPIPVDCRDSELIEATLTGFTRAARQSTTRKFKTVNGYTSELQATNCSICGQDDEEQVKWYSEVEGESYMPAQPIHPTCVSYHGTAQGERTSRVTPSFLCIPEKKYSSVLSGEASSAFTCSIGGGRVVADSWAYCINNLEPALTPHFACHTCINAEAEYAKSLSPSMKAARVSGNTVYFAELDRIRQSGRSIACDKTHASALHKIVHPNCSEASCAMSAAGL